MQEPSKFPWQLKQLKTEIEKRLEYWKRQLEDYSRRVETPAEPVGISGIPLYEPKNWWDRFMTFISGGFKFRSIWEPIPTVVDPKTGEPLIGTTWKELPWEAQERAKREAGEAFDISVRAQFFVDFYSHLPFLLSTGKVSSLEDYLEITGESGTSLTPQDIAEARSIIESATAREEEVPEWLEVSPEKEVVVREFLEAGTRPVGLPPQSIHQLSVEGIVKSLPAARAAKLPEGMSAEELLHIASVMDLPPESLEAVFDIDQAIGIIRDATLEKEQMIADVKAGIRDWEPPDMSFWQKAFFVVQSPLQQFADLLRPYLEHVAYPFAGTVSLMVQKALPGTQELEKFYAEARAEGIDPWHAAGKSLEEWNLAWYLKLPIEILADPITYTPGVLLSVPGKLAIKVGLKTLGRGILGINKGLWLALDLPFDAAKHFLGGFPKTSSQIIRHELDNFSLTFNAAVTRQTGKAVHQFTKEDVAMTLRAASEAFATNPKIDGNALVDLGRYLSEHVAMTDKQAYLWSRSHAGKLVEDVPASVVSEVNQIITDFVTKVGGPAANAKRMARALMVEETPENIAKLVKEIPAYSRKLSTNIDTVIQVGRTAQVEPVARMLNYMATRQKTIVSSRLAGKQAGGSALEGIALGLRRSVDKVENMRLRVLLDRYVVRTFAEANLGSISYPIWNAFEGVFVSLIEGVTPRFVKWEAYNIMTKGLLGDPKLAMQTASDVAGMFGTIAGRRAGAISLMPGILPERIAGWNLPKWAAGKDWLEWTGRKWIQMSDVWGNAFRRNYVTQKMARHLAERAYNVAGQDVNLAFQKLVKGSPKISKQTLGLTQHELEQEMFRRLTVSAEDVLGLKNILTDGSLQQGEMMKILREADHLSPRAKALGEQLIHEGKVLTNEVSVRDFIKQISDAAIDDLRRYPLEVADSFRYVANQIDTTAIKTRNDLMEIFTHYETMSETASFVPHRLMSQTMEESDLLERAARFGARDKLWKKARQDLLDTMQDITSSLEIVRNKLLANSEKLTAKQRMAMEAVLERSEASNLVREATLRADGELLDAFWALPRDVRKEEWAATKAARAELWANYRLESAVPSAGEFVTRRALAQLFHNLPEPKLTPVNAADRALSAQDIANVFGVNIDGLASGMLDNIAMHGKPYFIQLVKQSAEAKPNLFRGFTEEKIAEVYDNILAQARIRPDTDIMAQKILQQAEGMKQKLISLKMRHSLTPDEEKALFSWIDKAATGREGIISTKIPEVAPARTLAELERIKFLEARLSEAKKFKPAERPVPPPTATERAGLIEEATQEVVDAQANLRRAIAEGADVEDVTSLRGELASAKEALAETKKPFDTAAYEKAVAAAKAEDAVVAAQVTKLEGELAKLKAAVAPPAKLAPGITVKEIDLKGTFRFEAVHKDFPYAKGRVALILEPNYSVIVGLNVEESIQRLGAGSALMLRALNKAKLTRKPIIIEKVTPAGDALLKSMESRGLIKLTPLSDKLDIGIGKMVDVGGGKSISASYRIEMAVPKVPKKGLVFQDDWNKLRQESLDAANKDYYKAFADYTHENIVGATMKMIYPYWTYHTYRWFFLTRTALRHPGVPAAWGKYQNYGDYGFQPTPIPNVEANPFIGSVMGTTFTLTRKDFASYYENLGFAGEILDYTQRWGFYPGVHVMFPIVLSTYFSERPVEFGDIMPPIGKSGLNLLVASEISGVASAAKWLKDKVFHENFHEYYTATILDNKQVEAGGTLIGGQTGTDLWFKKLRGEKFTEEEQRLWDESFRDAAFVGLLRAQFPQFRLRTEDYREAYKQVTAIFEEHLGMSETFQKDLWRHHQRPTDVVGGLPLDVRAALDELWQWKIYFGRGSILMPPEVADLKALIDKYWKRIKDYQEDRLVLQADIDKGFIFPTKELHFDGREWRIEYAKNWGDYSSKTEKLKEEGGEFADAIEALTPEGQIRLAKRLGFGVPPTYPLDEAIDIYFDIKLEKYTDPYTGEEDWDYLTFWMKREAVRMALTEEQRTEFDNYIRRFQTPMEKTFRYIYNTYIRGFRASDRIIFESYSEEQKAIIKEFYATTTTLTRKEEIRELLSDTGKKLIAEYEASREDARAALRFASPTLDFYLYVFGYISKPKTPIARAMIDRWEADRSSILLAQE